MRHMEQLMRKALDGESLTARELQDFGAAMIAEPDLAEEYVALRRIVRDASRASIDRPSAGFADQVMARVAAAPLPERADRFPAWRLIGVGGALAAVVVVGLLGGAGRWLALETFWPQAVAALGYVADQGQGLARWLSGWNVALPATGQEAWLVWLAAPALALMAGVNVWTARFGRHGL